MGRWGRGVAERVGAAPTLQVSLIPLVVALSAGKTFNLTADIFVCSLLLLGYRYRRCCLLSYLRCAFSFFIIGYAA